MPIAPTHKVVNLRWLSAISLLDAVLLSLVAGLPSMATLTKDVAPQLTSALLLPPIVLWLCSLLGPDCKHRLVFWRWHHVLPGHRAFSIHAGRDPRFDVSALRKRVGKFPIQPREQNARWYKLYKEVQDAAPVIDAHRSFLLFRDLASVSVLLAVFVGAAFMIVGLAWQRTGAAVLILGIQYLLSIVASRISAHRLVRNVLAEHAGR